MSCYLVTYRDGAKRMRPVGSAAEYLALRNSEKQIRLVDACRMGNTEAKQRLLQMNYSCLPNDNGTLKGSTRTTTTVGMDVDFDPAAPDYEKRMADVPRLVLGKKEELGLLMLERSVRKGYHIVFRRRPELTQEQNLQWASRLLGVMYDEGAKDITRVFFTTTGSPDDLLFLDEGLFQIEKGGGCRPGTTLETPPPAESPTKARPAGRPLHPTHPVHYDGIGYDAIVEALEDQLGGVPAHGSRNNFIFTMACHLRYVCNDDPAWIAEVLPDYGEARDRWLMTIRSACARSQNKTMPKVLERALAVARANCGATGITGDPVAGCDGSGNGDVPPPMPDKLPPLIELLVSKTPKIYRAAVAHAVFPALATHLWRTRFRYIDNIEHEATLMNVLMAGTGAGKSCITAPIDHIMKDIRERDAISLEKERAWKEEMQTKGANKDKRKRPAGLVIQEVDADMTNAAFVLRMSEADEHFLYVKMNEIDQFDALKTGARSNSQFQIMCLAFDPGNTYGQTRVGAQSVSARVCVRFNWNASTTIDKGRQYFRSVLTDGPVSRINFCTIPEQPIGADMPVYGKYDDAFDAALKPYIDRLNAARGLVECPEAHRLALAMMEENADFARLSQSRTYENLSYRANVIAFLKAMVLYVAHGEQWSPEIENFIRWSELYDLWCKMRFFGEDIEKTYGKDTAPKRRGPKNLLEELPDRFTLDDVVEVRRLNNLSRANTMSMLANWKSRNYIAEDPGGRDCVWVKIPR